MTGLKIPFFGVSQQYKNHKEELLDATDRVLSSGQVMNGPETEKFERWLADKNQSAYAVTCHSGSQALEIIASYVATDNVQSDNPIAFLPSISFRATANAMIRSGWDLHFVDVDTYGLGKFKSVPIRQIIVSVGLFGLYPTLSRKELPANVIEDAAQHWLAGPPLGNRAISFDPTKNLGNYGNGGAVITNDIDLYHYAKHWCNNGRGIDVYGTNSRMSEVDCAQLLVKSRYIDAWQQRRKEIANYWIKRFAKNRNIRCLVTTDNIDHHSLQKFVISVDQRNKVIWQLYKKGIETKIHYETPLHEMYAQYPGPGLLSTASALCRNVLSLPIYPELTDAEVEYISQQVLDCVDS